MTTPLPPVPEELKSAFIVYLKEYEDNLAFFSKKNSVATFVFSEDEQKAFQERFHRLKGASGFFHFKEIAELAVTGGQLFHSLPQISDFSRYQQLYNELSNYLESLKTI